MSNNKQQTVVEWLYLQMKKYCDDSNVPNDLLEQAKEIEKEQIKDAYANGSNDRLKNRVIDYYNETYGGNNEN
jgi:hypothetical protein